MAEQDETEQNSLNISIKEEPLDDYGLVGNILCDIRIKEESEDEYIAKEPHLNNLISSDDSFISSTTSTNVNMIKTNSNIDRDKIPLISDVSEVNGTVKPTGNYSSNFGAPHNSILKVQCPRCKGTVVMEEFRSHIDSCPPRKTATKRLGKTISECTDNIERTLPDSTVEQSPFSPTKDPMEARNSLSIQARRSRIKSCHEIAFNNYDSIEELKGLSKRIRSKSISIEMDTAKSLEVKTDNYPFLSNENHTNEMAPHQRILKLRSKSVSNNLVLNTKPISDEENIDQSKRDSKNATARDDSLLLEDNTFSCSMCSFTTDKQRTLREHERNHKKNNTPIFQCIYCNQKYTRHALYLHIQDVHPGQKFEIADDNHGNENNVALSCRSKKNSKRHFREGRQIDHQKSIFKCSQCSYVSKKSQKDITRHEIVHRQGLPIFKCSSCNFFSTWLAVKFHEKRCKKSEINRAHVKLREKTSSKNEINPVNLSENKCPECSYTCHNKSKLEIHIRIHEKKVSILPCPNNCGFNSTSVALKAHVKKCKANSNTKSISFKTNGKTFKCLKCPFSTNLRIKLNIHNMKRHCQSIKSTISTRGAFKCSICLFSASIQRHLDLHMKKHGSNVTSANPVELDSTTSEKKSNVNCTGILERKKPQFKCPHCQFLTNLRIKLNIHMKTHDVDFQVFKRKTDNIPKKISDTERSLLHCTKCTFTTDIPSELKTHIKMPHVNLFHCKLCSAVFNRQSHLQIHMGQHGLNKPMWKCPYCNFISSLNCFIRHMRKHLQADPSLEWFRCKMCSYIATKQMHLDRHLIAHKSRQPVKKCPYCFFSSTPRQLADHIFQHNIQKKKEHSILNQNNNLGESKPSNAMLGISIKLPSIKILTRSVREPTKQCPTNLAKAGTKTTDSTSELKKFFGNLSSPQIRKLGKRKLLKCKFCSADGMTLSCLKNHLQTHITKQVIKQCQYCTFKSTFNCLLKHVRKHHRHERQTDIGKQPSGIQSADEISSEKKVNLRKLPNRSNLRSLDHPSKIQTSVNKDASVENGIFLEASKLSKRPETDLKLFKCKSCSARCKTLVSLKLHMQAHFNKQPIKKCRLCSFRSTPRYLMYHMAKHKQTAIQHKEEKSFKCESCSFEALEYKYLQSHLKTHVCASTSTIADDKANQKPASRNSDLSSPSIKRKNDHESRITNVKRKTVIGKERSNNKDKSAVYIKNNKSSGFRCSLCPYFTHLRIKLNIHKRKRHPLSGNEENKDVEKRKLDNSSEESCLSFNSDCKRAKKETENRDSKEGIFYCSFCSFTSLVRTSWKKHMSSHMTYNLPILQCQYCGFKGTLNQFKSHEKKCAYSSGDSKTNPPQKILLNCVKCSFTTYFPAALKNHKLNDHTDTKSIQNLGAIKSFKCEYCSFSSYWQYLIERHRLSHTVLKLPIEQCPNCDFRSTTAALQAHVNKCTKKSQQHFPSDNSAQLPVEEVRGEA